MPPVAEYLDAAIEAARRGAAELEAWRPKFAVREKSRANLVTDADFASQQAVRDYLLGRFPDHGFIAEEGDDAVGSVIPGSPPTWVVDPLDGTTNYVHDVPAYCVSVGLLVEGEAQVGAIYDPRMNEMFVAVRGQGAYLNGRRLQVSDSDRIGDALLASGFSSDLADKREQLKWWEHFSLTARSLRRTGSCALNLAYVAAGRFDGFWACENQPWDVCAGVVLVREAGGRVSHMTDPGFSVFRPDILATNGRLHAAISAAFQPA